jgi:thioredoxin 1
MLDKEKNFKLILRITFNFLGIIMKPMEFTDQNFSAEVLQSDKPVLVDFWAVWCGPCKMIAPFVEELAGEFEGKAKVGKLDVDNNQETAIKYGVRSIPTVLVFKGGKVVDTIIGAVPKVQLKQKLQAAL